MKTLHLITPMPRLVFMTLPCDDNYHNGYQHERTERTSHSTCLQVGNQVIAGETVEVCECQTCGNRDLPAHYMTAPYEIIDMVSFEDDLGHIICPQCRNDMHPERRTPA